MVDCEILELEEPESHHHQNVHIKALDGVNRFRQFTVASLSHFSGWSLRFDPTRATSLAGDCVS